MGAAGWTQARPKHVHRFWGDFGTRVCLFLAFKKLKVSFFVELVSRSFCLSISELKFRRLGLPNRGFRMECIANVDFSWKPFLMNFGMGFCRYLEALGAVFLVFWALKTYLKIEGFLEM